MSARKGIRGNESRKRCGPRELPKREAILEYGGVPAARDAFNRLVRCGVAPDEIDYILQRVAWWYRPETTAKLLGFPPEIPDYTIKRLPRYIEDVAVPIARLTSFPAWDPRGNSALSDGDRQDLARLPERLNRFARYVREEQRIRKIVEGMRTSCKLEFLQLVKDTTGNTFVEDVATLLTAVLVADGHPHMNVTTHALKMLQKRRLKGFLQRARTTNTFPSDSAALAAVASRDQTSLVAQLLPAKP